MFKIIPIIIALFIANQDEKKDSQQGFYTLDNPADGGVIMYIVIN